MLEDTSEANVDRFMGDQEGSRLPRGQGTEKWVVGTNQSFKICRINNYKFYMESFK